MTSQVIAVNPVKHLTFQDKCKSFHFYKIHNLECIPMSVKIDICKQIAAKKLSITLFSRHFLMLHISCFNDFTNVLLTKLNFSTVKHQSFHVCRPKKPQ